MLVKTDIYTFEDTIAKYRSTYPNLSYIVVIEHNNEHILDIMLKNNVDMVCFDFAPESIENRLKRFYEVKQSIEANKNKPKSYIINFYENKGVFIIDLSGTLDKDKVSALKLMFQNYLSGKLKTLKGVIYVFNNTDENSMLFQHIWSLFKFWGELGVTYKKLYFLTSSEFIDKNIYLYTNALGVNHYSNLIDIIKNIYPEMSSKDEMELFEFASALLQPDTK